MARKTIKFPQDHITRYRLYEADKEKDLRDALSQMEQDQKVNKWKFLGILTLILTAAAGLIVGGLVLATKLTELVVDWIIGT